MASPAPGGMDATAAESALVGQVVDFVQWVGDGRKLTQKGAITRADAFDIKVGNRGLVAAGSPR